MSDDYVAYIKHPIYGSVIEGDLNGELTVTRAGKQVGTVKDMTSAIKIAKRAMLGAASVFDRTPEDAPERPKTVKGAKPKSDN